MEQRLKEILKERGRELASVYEKESVGTDNNMEMLLFKLSDETYAIKSSYVNEVVFIKEITPLPCTPDFLLGIINVRGRIISVIDIRKFFGLPDKGIGNLNRVIVVEGDEMEFGLLTDEIEGNTIINMDILQKEISGITEISDNYIRGVSKDNTIVLDITRIINDDRIIINDSI